MSANPKKEAKIASAKTRNLLTNVSTSLHDYQKTSGTTKLQIQIGELAFLHDDVIRTNWKLAIEEKLTIMGLDAITRATKIRTARWKDQLSHIYAIPMEVNDK